MTGATAAPTRPRPAPPSARVEAAGLVRRHDRADQGRRHPGVGLDRVLRGVVARHRRAEDEAPLVRAFEGPEPHGAGHRQPALGPRLPPSRPPAPPGRPPARPLGQGLVGGEDEGAEEGVTAVEVAVQGRGRHAQVTGDGAQRQGGCAVAGQMRAGHGQDLARHLLPDPGAGGARRGGGGGVGGACVQSGRSDANTST